MPPPDPGSQELYSRLWTTRANPARAPACAQPLYISIKSARISGGIIHQSNIRDLLVIRRLTPYPIHLRMVYSLLVAVTKPSYQQDLQTEGSCNNTRQYGIPILGQYVYRVLTSLLPDTHKPTKHGTPLARNADGIGCNTTLRRDYDRVTGVCVGGTTGAPNGSQLEPPVKWINSDGLILETV